MTRHKYFISVDPSTRLHRKTVLSVRDEDWEVVTVSQPKKMRAIAPAPRALPPITQYPHNHQKQPFSRSHDQELEEERAVAALCSLSQ